MYFAFLVTYNILGCFSGGKIWKQIFEPWSLGSRYIKATDESTLGNDFSVPLMHGDPKWSWINDPFWDFPKKMHSNINFFFLKLLRWRDLIYFVLLRKFINRHILNIPDACTPKNLLTEVSRDMGLLDIRELNWKPFNCACMILSVNFFFSVHLKFQDSFMENWKIMQSVTFFPRYTNGFILPPSFDGWGRL